MDHTKEIRSCLRCRNRIPFTSIREECILGEDWMLCPNCVKPHVQGIVSELEIFRRSLDFFNENDIKKKMVWLKEKIGDWADDIKLDTNELIGLQRDYLDHELFLIELLIGKYGERDKIAMRENLLDFIDGMAIRDEIV